MKKFITALIIAALSHTAFAATAFFTGEQTMVQTVTYQMAWKCGYRVNGQHFYRIFQGSCPSSVEVY